MKKSIILALLVCVTMGMKAQEEQMGKLVATPILVQLTPFSLDSLRANTLNPIQLRDELLLIQNKQKNDAAAIAQAKQQLKDEQALLKSAMASLADSKKYTDKLEKAFANESKLYAEYRKIMDKQLLGIKKAAHVDMGTRFALENRAESEVNRIGMVKEELNKRQRELVDFRKQLEVVTNEVNSYNSQLQQKANDLQHLADTQKVQAEAIKTELKNVAAQIKGK